jgi:hypothetical protein
MLSFSSLFGSTDADSLERLDRMILRGPELHFHEIADDADNFSQQSSAAQVKLTVKHLQRCHAGEGMLPLLLIPQLH